MFLLDIAELDIVPGFIGDAIFAKANTEKHNAMDNKKIFLYITICFN
jgi:hypothetical protein